MSSRRPSTASGDVVNQPAWLHFRADAPIEQLQSVGVAISTTGPGRWHIGIVHGSRGKEILLLHLAWHHRLCNESPGDEIAWIQLQLPALRLRSIAAFCRLVWRRHRLGGLPYAFRYAETSFASDGRLRLGATEHGLTCATFVLALLRATGVELMDLSTWPTRPDDAAWHAEVIELLRRHGAPPEHIARVRSEVGCARFRPQEVAGACSEGTFPTSFGSARSAASRIEAAFASRTAVDQPPALT